MTSFPRLALLVPPVFPLTLHAVGWAGAWKQATVHTIEPWVLVLWLLYVAAALIGLVMVPYASYRFVKVDDFRTGTNLLCIVLGAGLPVLVAGVLLKQALRF